MKKIMDILKELNRMMKKHGFPVFAPMMIILAVFAFFVYCIGPAVIISFDYAGI